METNAKEPNALLGAGATRCEAFLKLRDNADTAPAALGVFAWVQGWFSAKNYFGDEDGPVAVGGSVSADSLQSMLVEECRAKPKIQVYLAAESIYEHLKQKGL